MNKQREIVSALLIIDFVLLIIFGKTYSKLEIFEFGFHAHDLFLLILAFFCAFKFNFKQNRIYSIEIVLGLSIVYLIVSFWNIDFNFTSPKIFYIVRQYAIVGYIGIFYVISKFLFEGKELLKYL